MLEIPALLCLLTIKLIVCGAHTHTHNHTLSPARSIHIHARTRTLTRMHTRTETYTHTRTHTYACMHRSPAHTQRGSPSKFEARIDCTGNEIDYTLRWFNKTATHAPETFWLSHVPSILNQDEKQQNKGMQAKMFIDKLGSDIDPLESDLGCSSAKGLTCGIHLHAAGDKGVSVVRGQLKASFSALDSALVSIGSPDPVPTPLIAPDISGGIHFGLVGNIWNTNYPFWYPFVKGDENAQYRFRMKVEHE